MLTVNQLLVVSVRLLVNSWLLIVKILGSQKFYADLTVVGGWSALLTPVFCRGQLYQVCAFNSKVIVFAKFEQNLEVDTARYHDFFGLI